MTPLQLVFLFVALVTLASAVLVVTARKMMHAALWLVLTLLGVAILYAILEASFFVAIQVVVYIGAIAILIIFAIMLTRKVMQDTGAQVQRYAWLAALIALGTFIGLVSLLSLWPAFQTPMRALPAGANDVAELGKALVSPDGFVIPFEIASVLLLAAMIGAVFVAGNPKQPGGEEK